MNSTLDVQTPAISAGGPLAALQAVQTIAQQLSSGLDLDVLVQRVLQAGLQVMQAGGGTLFLHDASTDELVFEVIEGDGKGQLEGKRLSPTSGIAGWSFTHGETLIVNDVSQDPRFNASFDKSSGYHTHALIAAPLIVAGKTIGVLELLNKRSGEPFNNDDAGLLAVLAAQSAVAIENARLYRHLWNERNRILAVEEEVRRELAREIHDGPAQLLSAMVMNVRFAQALLADGSTAMVQDELTGLEDLATRALVQVRGLLFSQRPVVLETQGLFPALEMFVKRLQDARELNVGLEVGCAPVHLPGRGDQTVFSIVQEAVGNAKKHAPGARVSISVQRDGDRLVVVVADDGPGFDVAAVRSTYDKRGSLGLLNMSERAEQLGGSVDIQSTAGQGTRVTLSVPDAALAAPAIP